MGRSPQFSVDKKVRIASLVLSGHKAKDVASQYGTSETSVGRWAKQLLASGRAGLMPGGDARLLSREDSLESQVEEYKAALGEAHAELRMLRKEVEGRSGLLWASK